MLFQFPRNFNNNKLTFHKPKSQNPNFPAWPIFLAFAIKPQATC